MEEYLSFALVGFLGLILAVLSRSLVKMYERLWTDNAKKGDNPSEMFGIFLEAINEANKKQEDRLRKRKDRATSTEDGDTTSPVYAKDESAPGEDTLETRVNALWEHYKELGGEG